jgi:molybdopterin converting factor small subunit
MIVRVRLYAGLNKHIPGLSFGEAFSLELPAEAVLETLIAELKLPRDIQLYCIVNGQVRDFCSQLLDGDEIDIFPPVGGG